VNNKKKTFLQLPQIIGGKETLKKYFETNLIYPPEAREKRIEGTVELNAEIDDNSQVIQVEILKGLAGGCNEEAIRLIKNVRFGAVKNKGIRLKTKKRFRVKFQLPFKHTINYQLVNQKEETSSKGITKTYSYTIQIK
jgi:TonB family protein